MSAHHDAGKVERVKLSIKAAMFTVDDWAAANTLLKNYLRGICGVKNDLKMLIY